ncbi:hypothetical protein CONLIGDRAFT_630491 [Coniochaeta ligniaria NRRL 30616]|uniref:Uncharacterized protein n=1 Tax=Coniochaeta ligniaria NRRL 30616 TaxID=1408157 RepID=A0A1J7JRW5_9PEZI|nr:hypothetical protein CONLIGDRAFT_630491 [Coniochaeta ligniaria NRRL 30616]
MSSVRVKPPSISERHDTPKATQARWYKFWLGWTLVQGYAQPIVNIVNEELGERQTWHHVLRLRVHPGVLATTIRRVSNQLPTALHNLITEWFPGLFLPDTVIIKELKPDWDEEFNNEIRMYRKLKPIQDVVVPVFYGEIRVDGTRALLLSDVGGKPLVAVTFAEHRRNDLERMVQTALRAIYGLGVSPCDANLVNCHVVGDRVMIVDHEQDEDLEEGLRDRLDEVVEAKAERIMARHWEVHKPKKPTKARDPSAERRAAAKYRLRSGHLLSGTTPR